MANDLTDMLRAQLKDAARELARNLADDSQEEKPKRLSGMKGLVIGAGVTLAAKMAIDAARKGGPGLVTELSERINATLAEVQGDPEEDQVDQETDDQEPEAELEEDEPAAEADDQEPEAEEPDAEEPEAEEPEAEEPEAEEPEAEADETPKSDEGSASSSRRTSGPRARKQAGARPKSTRTTKRTTKPRGGTGQKAGASKS